MPFCSDCNTEFDDRIRRCPHCGTDVEQSDTPVVDPTDDDGRFDETPAGVLAFEQSLFSRQKTVVATTAAAALLAVVGVLCLPGSTPEEETFAKSARKTPHRAVRRTASRGTAARIKPVPPEQDLKITSIIREDHGVVLTGTCSALGAVRIHVEGNPAVIEPSGNAFWARVPGRPEVLLVEAFSLDGRAELAVKVPESLMPPAYDDTVLLSHAECQTVHEREIRIQVDGGGLRARRRNETVVLPNVRNEFVIGGRQFTLFRAPVGLVFLRVTKKGQYAFLREIDGQEMVLIPNGIASRGFGEKTSLTTRTCFG